MDFETMTKEHFDNLKNSNPETDKDKLYRYLYLKANSYVGNC